jgi:hypothetical protein
VEEGIISTTTIISVADSGFYWHNVLYKKKQSLKNDNEIKTFESKPSPAGFVFKELDFSRFLDGRSEKCFSATKPFHQISFQARPAEAVRCPKKCRNNF